jgi:hypothetical protein
MGGNIGGNEDFENQTVRAASAIECEVWVQNKRRGGGQHVPKYGY